MNTAETWVSHHIYLNDANTLATIFTHRLCYLGSYPAWIGNKTVMADIIHQMTAGGCSLEGQCIYVHFLFILPIKEVFTC